MSYTVLLDQTDLTKEYPYVNEWRELPNGVLVQKLNVGGGGKGQLHLKYYAWERSSIMGPHHAFTHVEAKGGKCYGQVRSINPPESVMAFPAGSPERIAGVQKHYEEARLLEDEYIRAAFPEDF